MRLLLSLLVVWSLMGGLCLILLLGLTLIGVSGPPGLLKSLEVQRVWEIHDDRLQFILLLDESLRVGDVSRALLVWSRAAETALADPFRFAGGPVPVRCLGVGRVTARFRVVRLGGLEVRKARGIAKRCTCWWGLEWVSVGEGERAGSLCRAGSAVVLMVMHFSFSC